MHQTSQPSATSSTGLRLTQQDTTNGTQVSTNTQITGNPEDTYLRIWISNLPVLVVIKDCGLPLRPFCISTVGIRWQLGGGIAGDIIQVLLCKSIFAPFLIVRQWWVGEPVFRGVIGGLGETLLL